MDFTKVIRLVSAKENRQCDGGRFSGSMFPAFRDAIRISSCCT
jgi:hypothetical protein